MAGLGTTVALIKALGSPDPAVIEQSVSDWLDDHPEATTTVEDGSITKAKLDSNLQGTVDDVSDLKNAIKQDEEFFYDACVDLKELLYWEQGTIASNGTISSAHTSSNIYTEGLIPFPITYSIDSNQTLYIAKYKNGVFVSRASTGAKTGTITFDSSFDRYRLMLFYTNDTKTPSQMLELMYYCKSIKQDEIDGMDSEIGKLLDNTVINFKDLKYWKQGTISSTGGISSAHTSSNIYTEDAIAFPVSYKVDNNQSVYLVKYKNGAFVSRASTGVKEGTITFDSTFDSFRIMLLYLNDTLSPTEMLTMVSYFESIVQNGDKGLGFLNRISCSHTGNKIVHYSVDDTYAVLKDLTTNADTYTSIFDNATLSALLSIHNSTGLCVTLNTFNTVTSDNTYSISNVPEKEAFQAEFQANKNWLKFAFHAEADLVNYDTATGISTSYDTFVSAIYKLTGDYDCIDAITRLGYFGGSLMNILTLKNKAHGIIGLLCADETDRASYYLSNEQNDIVQQKGMYLDLMNELVFIKTITRHITQNAIEEIEGNLCYQKYVELFSHESDSGWTTNCATMAQWAKENGYVFAFPSLIFNLNDTFGT